MSKRRYNATGTIRLPSLTLPLPTHMSLLPSTPSPSLLSEGPSKTSPSVSDVSLVATGRKTRHSARASLASGSGTAGAGVAIAYCGLLVLVLCVQGEEAKEWRGGWIEGAVVGMCGVV